MNKIKISNTQIPGTICHLNGGIEQALLLLAEEENCISDKDKIRLNDLKKLPQNRVEFNGKIFDFEAALKTHPHD